MSGLLYYFPGATRRSIGDMGDFKLRHVFPAELNGQSITEVQTGPSGDPGIVIADPQADLKVGYYVDEQTWRKVPKSKAQVGYFMDNKPKPGDLARKRQLQGHFVTLGDGNEWLVPVARQVVNETTHTCALPTIATVNDEGEWNATDVRPQYAQLWDIAQRWWDNVTKQFAHDDDGETAPQDDTSETVTFEFADILEAAVCALTVNYKLGNAEVSLLELLDLQIAQEVLLAVVDWPSVVQLAEKKTG